MCLIFNILGFGKKVQAMEKSLDDFIDAPLVFAISREFSFIRSIVLYLSFMVIFHVSKLCCGKR